MNPNPLCPPVGHHAILLAGVDSHPTPTTEKPVGSESEAGPFHWAKSKADLCRVKAKVRAMYRANGNQQDFNGWGGPHKYEIGKGKTGMVAFLNLHATHDNG